MGSPGKRETTCRQFSRFGKIQKRRQERAGLDNARRRQLRNAEDLNFRLPPTSLHEGNGRVRRPEIDADEERSPNHCQCASRGPRFADVQLELPAMRTIPGFTPELERTDFTESAFERDRDDPLICRRDPARIMFQRNLEATELVEIVAPILDDRAWLITLADRRREKPKLRRLPHGQSKFASGDRRAGPL